MGIMVPQITSLAIVYSTIYSGTDQRKHQSSTSLAFVRGIHRLPVNSPHKGPVTRKMFPFDDVIMRSSVEPIEDNTSFIFITVTDAPTVVRPPPDMRMVQQGETLTIECEAIGVPTPLIVWRLNWGHVGRPPRVTSTSENGRGVLTIRDAKPEDSGAYTCEAVNNKNSVFGQPDTMVIVKRKYELYRLLKFMA